MQGNPKKAQNMFKRSTVQARRGSPSGLVETRNQICMYFKIKSHEDGVKKKVESQGVFLCHWKKLSFRLPTPQYGGDPTRIKHSNAIGKGTELLSALKSSLRHVTYMLWGS